MNRKLSIILLLFLIRGSLWSESIGSDKEIVHPISMEVFDGEGSLLLHWTFEDTIIAKEIKIFKKNSQDEDFNFISNVGVDSDRYLDNNCKALDRYFYFIEVIDEKGRKYISDNIRPSFGTSMLIENTETFDVSSTWDIISHLINKSLSQFHPDFGHGARNGILNLLSKNTVHRGSWIENFPLKHFTELKSMMEKNSRFFPDYQNLKEEIEFFEKKYRNELLLTPKEWDTNIRDLFSFTKEKWYLLVDSFQLYQDQIEKSPPLIFSGSSSDNDLNEAFLHLINPEQLVQKKTALKYNDKNIDLHISASILAGSELRYTVPQNWEYAELIFEDKIIDRIDFLANEKLLKTLDNDIIPVKTINGLKQSRKRTNLWINEIYWNPNNRNLSIEVAGFASEQQHIIRLNNDVLWNVDMNYSYDMQFSDSTFNLDLDKHTDPIVLYYDLVKEDAQETIEMIKILTSEVINAQRFPDGEKWINTKENTFGSKNIEQRSVMDNALIPELFVLYQNYPNPFNSNTRISFDLLQDATLSLYVTDATGRVKTIFSDQEFYVSGKYNFDWNAENFSTGVYFFTINAEVDGYLPVIFSRKMIYLK